MYTIATIESGPLIRRIRYPSTRSSGPGARISEQTHPTSDWMQRINDRHCWESLSLWLHAYHSLDDLFVTLSYSDAWLPPTYLDAKKRLTAFLRKYREECRRLRIPHSYIYVLEGEHGDHRIHHHLIVYAGKQREVLRRLWIYGGVHIETIREFGSSRQDRSLPALQLSEYIMRDGSELGAARYAHDCYQKIAKYMTKEPRKTGRVRPGGRAYTPSRDRYRPQVRKEQTEIGGQLPIPPGYVELTYEQKHDGILCFDRQTL